MIVLSDPKKKTNYDKYGTVDDDNFDIDDFMKHFADMFGGNFMENGAFFEQMMAGGMDSRHGYKLMYLRKKANNEPLYKPSSESKKENDNDVNFFFI
jgi:DnaJ-class molecular chaperone